MTFRKPSLQIGPGAFRLFLAALVVVHHSFPLRLGSWAVYVFFVLSGYWISHMWQRKYQHTSLSYITFIVSRWWRLAPVFLFCTILGIISSQLLHQETAPIESWTWWLRQILVVGSASAGRLLPPTWSLDVEMQFYLLAPLFISGFLLLPWAGRIGLTAMGFGYLMWQLSRGFRPDTPTLDLHVASFTAGICINQSNWKPSKGLAYSSIAAFFLILFVLLLLPATRSGVWVRGETQSLHESTFTYAWPELCWVLGTLVMLPFVAFNVRQASPPRDRWIGNLAYPLYLFHWLPRDWYYHFVDWSKPISHNLFLLLLNWAIALLGAIFILSFVDTPIDRWRARWVSQHTSPAPPQDITPSQVH